MKINSFFTPSIEGTYFLVIMAQKKKELKGNVILVCLN